MDVTGLVVSGVPTHVLALSGASGISPTTVLMLVLAVVGLTIVMLSTRRRIADLGRRSHTSVRERYGRLAEESNARRNVEEVMLELDKLSRQVHGRIDTKLARLETLIRDADQRIAKLSRLSPAPKRGSTLEITLDREDPGETVPGDPGGGNSDPEAVYRLADGGMSPVQIAEKIGQPIGEIELVLALRKTRSEAGGAAASMTAVRPGSKK